MSLYNLVIDTEQYLKSGVNVSIAQPVPSGKVINPGETFTIEVTAKNVGDALHSPIRLKNVCYHVKIDNPSVAKLVVPKANPDDKGYIYKSGPPGKYLVAELEANKQVAEMYVYPHGGGNAFSGDTQESLGAGDSDTIELKGIAISGSATGLVTKIWCDVYAEPDLAFLFPSKQGTSAGNNITVVST